MNETRAASILARWLAHPIAGEIPPGLDRDVVETVLAIRPQLAGPPTLSAEDVLASITTGPLASHGTFTSNVVAFPVPPGTPESPIGDPPASPPSPLAITKLTPLLIAALVLLAVLPKHLPGPQPPVAASESPRGTSRASVPTAAPPPESEDHAEEAQASEVVAAPAPPSPAPAPPSPAPAPPSPAPAPRAAPTPTPAQPPPPPSDATALAPAESRAPAKRRGPGLALGGALPPSRGAPREERIDHRMISAASEGAASIGAASESWQSATPPEVVRAVEALLAQAADLAQSDPTAASRKLADFSHPATRATQVVHMQAAVYARRSGDLNLARQIASLAIARDPKTWEAAELRRFLQANPLPDPGDEPEDLSAPR